MARFHINPQTGNPGACSAEISCPFGDINQDHYGSKEEARAAYEAKQEAGLVASPVRKPRAKNWVLLRYSDITGKTYVDGMFSQERQLQKKLAELNRYDHHSAHFSGARAEDAIERVSDSELPQALRDLKAELAQKARGEAPTSPPPVLPPVVAAQKEEPKQKLDLTKGFFQARNDFSHEDFQSLRQNPVYRERVKQRYDEIVDEYHAERKKLEATEEGREELLRRERKDSSRRAGNYEAQRYHGRGDTYYYVSKTGGVRETHTKGSAAIPKSMGFATEWDARAHRDVTIGELQAKGLTKKQANELFFAYNSGELRRRP